MLRQAAIAIVLCGLAAPVLATEWLYCSDPANEAGAELLLGQADTLFIDSFTLNAGAEVWASGTAVGPGAPVTLGQFFSEADRLDADFLDEGGALLAQLRLRYASEGEASVYGGTLRIVGKGAWAVSCPAA